MDINYMNSKGLCTCALAKGFQGISHKTMRFIKKNIHNILELREMQWIGTHACSDSASNLKVKVR
jgi:hypothetical protein